MKSFSPKGYTQRQMNAKTLIENIPLNNRFLPYEAVTENGNSSETIWIYT